MQESSDHSSLYLSRHYFFAEVIGTVTTTMSSRERTCKLHLLPSLEVISNLRRAQPIPIDLLNGFGRVAEELGYVGFAADIYGKEFLEVENTTVRGQLAGLYRGDPDLFTGRIQAAIDLVQGMPEVDPENIALAGYCFGG